MKIAFSRRAGGGVVLGLWVVVAATSGPLRATEPEKSGEIPTLEVVRRLSLPGGLSPARDIRWLERDSLLVLRARDGVSEHALKEGMPRLRHVLPGRNQDQAIGTALFLGAADELVLACGNGSYLWTGDPRARGNKASRLVRFGGDGTADCDTDGRVIFALGLPDPPEDVDRWGETLVWRGELEGDLARFEPLLREQEPTTDHGEINRRQTHHNIRAGSLAVSARGRLLVSPAHTPELYLASSTGKVTHRWELSVLLAESEPDWEAKLADPRTPALDVALAYVGRRAVVDDVFFVNEEPALVLRSLDGSRRRWTLVRPQVDGFLIEKIPMSGGSERSRVRAAARRGSDEVAFLMADFGIGSPESSDDQEVLIARVGPGYGASEIDEQEERP